MKRFGIFSGSFNPVHAGHVSFARAAIKHGKLDTVFFAPEIQPRRKSGVTHIAHRIAMLKLALADEPGMEVLELPDKHFSVAKTLPRLKKLFPDAELYYLAGSDMLEHMPEWRLVEVLLRDIGLLVGLRSSAAMSDVRMNIGKLPAEPKEIVIIKSPNSSVSSQKIREDIGAFRKPANISPPVQRYIDEHWLYHVIKN